MTSKTSLPLVSLNVETAVRDRYSAASQKAEAALCCSVSYDVKLLAVLPDELLERDYGCGDPSRWVKRGENVLDLGSGGGKICYIASQIVGPDGSVVGVDMNDDMLQLARTHQPSIAEKIGWDNVSFRKGRIQDLALDLDQLNNQLATQPINDVSDWLATQHTIESLRSSSPMIADESIDVVLSNCVLNLVTPGDRSQLFSEVFRVLRPGGRAVISDIVSNRDVPWDLQQDAELWSGCISGAFEESEFLRRFADAGFIGIEVVVRQAEPWQVVDGIEFRSVTVRAYKPTPIDEENETEVDVMYLGPWHAVLDDTGIELTRGEHVQVPQSVAKRLTSDPYSGQVLVVGNTPMDNGDDRELPRGKNDCCAPGSGCC